jgi:thiol-disulfide isomerase/thioredoxin
MQPATGTREGITGRRWIRGGALFCVLLCGVAATIVRAEGPSAGVTHALLINGGQRPASNFQSHLQHLQDMVDLLEWRGVPLENIHIFSGDGEDPAPDLAVREVRPPQFWLIAGTRIGKRLRPRSEVTNTPGLAIPLQPAHKAALSQWFDAARRDLNSGDRLLIFVTDHGTGNPDEPDNGALSLWNDKLEVREFRELLRRLRSGVHVVMIMSQCYSGTFASVIDTGGASVPSGDVCGFFSTARDLPAYGCYPEGRDRDRIGHAFRFIDALHRRATTDAAHEEVLVADNTPDVPLRTSDIYLEHLVTEEARARGVEMDVLVDRMLVEAWKDRAAWKREIRLLDRIGDTYGTFSPRSITEIGAAERELPPAIDRMKTFADRWKTALIAVAEENAGGFVAARPQWRERLDEKALKQLDATGRRALLAEVLPLLAEHARGDADLWRRIETLRDRADRAAAARWRLKIRKAALQRMRTVLVGVAGRVLLANGGEAPEDGERWAAQGDALAALDRCETLEPGTLPISDLAVGLPVVEPFPPLVDELQLLEELLPSWLGVRFRPVPKALRSGRQLPAGATWLEAVYPDSPAEQAGLQDGDIVLGPPGHPFTAAGQLREWTMTSPRGVPLSLAVVRPAGDAAQDQTFEITLSLEPYPIKWPALPGPRQAGDKALPLPAELKMVGSGVLPDLSGRPYLLFFWATWCQPCKQAVPEVMAFAEDRGLTVVAISDEAADTVAAFLAKQGEGFVDTVAVDPLRKSFIAYGVSGTPTILLVDEHGLVRHRQVGYNPAKGLTVKGWSWAKP